MIATLNYDNSIELLAKSQSIPWTTGIDQWSTSGCLDFTEHKLLLLKLHGSIDWTWGTTDKPSNHLMLHKVIRRIEPDEMKDRYEPAVIFGQRNKLTAEGPFLDLLIRFREQLSKASRLTVVGYSFRDMHINVYISQWLNSSQDHAIRIISPDITTSHTEYVQELRDLQRRHPNKVELTAMKAKEGLKELYGPRASL